ncbi:interleukin-1 receptor-like 1 isoform X2 [Dicentrarchus labrax]|uniref:interleukin-1 receptor-like 1 isoform X2 n=1 Tax=Dicentrarchus labrax TaxID=13489 RepID=UPI0021F5F19D|nr:interleukin-1 receptor-like 1 isoform X2 [Dicentrarchus labrax]
MRDTIMKAVKMLAALSFLLLTLLTGVSPQTARKIYVKTGELVALQCPHYTGNKHNDTKLIWTSYTTQERDLTAEQRPVGILVHGRSLVILSVSVFHQGNYSCSLGNASKTFWFTLTVYKTQTKEYEEKTMYTRTCYTQESCKLQCPRANIPAANIQNITSKGIIWHKEGKSFPTVYFPSLEEKDRGAYTCTRSYLYHGQTYNMTFIVKLDVQPNDSDQAARIISPLKSEVISVDLGSRVVIDCKAVVYSNVADVFWLSGKSFVDSNNNSRVFYNSSREYYNEVTRITASLVFKKVLEEDLLKNYTCKLQTDNQRPSFVTVTLAQKVRPSYISLALGIVCTVVVMVFTVVIYVKFKINITLFLRDTLGCHSSTSDGKSYDAYLMCYKSDTEAGLNEDDRKWLESVLEERFGYSLCLYDRDVLPGKAEAEAVLESIEQSRTVVLVPTSPDPGPGFSLLSAIHAALVERQTRMVFIKTETTEQSRSGSLPEALQILSEAGNCVTWKGISSIPPSSSFWKQLRYHLPAPQHAPKLMLLPQKI